MLWLLLILVSYAYDACHPGFNEQVNIRVLDEQGRPIPNATVQLKYLLDGSIYPKLYRWTELKQTNEYGLASFYVYNRQKYAAGLDCRIWVNLTLFGKPYSYKVRRDRIIWDPRYILTLRNKTTQYVYYIPAYKLTLAFKEGNKSVKADKLVIFDRVLENVTLFSAMVPSNISGMAVYKTIKRYFNFVLKNDTYYEIQFSKNPYTIEVFDDRGQPLSCSFNNMSFTGTLKFKAFDTSIKGILKCKNKEKSLVLTPYHPTKIILDVTPPNIENFRLIRADTDYVTLAFDVWDPNKYASGLKRVELFFNGDLYVAIDKKGSSYYYRIPNMEGKIKIIAVDNMDNYKYVLLNYTPQYKSSDNTSKRETNKKGGDISWMVVGIGILILGGIVWFIKSKFEEPDEL